ncbi:putative Non-specific protein-tyrosine kinase [Nitrosotalea devaniterrae]|uniref:Putative Non-specific protein-tyrosine kinase n=1 Tax=Nitrosotalea devaniterrae TaxID=1078905 RepID=A0A128A1W5_9ARCH|nr:putative Non-specific protein-tyrosine kinase [Candidatus Nitrosotalea devanaterra]
MIKSKSTSPILPSLCGMHIGKYVIGKEIDEGGFGVMYEAIDTTLDNRVAIKFLKSTSNSKWMDEARKAAKLQNVPQIATVIEFKEEKKIVGQQEYTLRYIVWQFVEGQTLEKFLDQTDHLSTSSIVNLVTEICMGIAAMREVGLEHGDLHPRNIMIVPPKSYDPWKRYGIKILDFGLAGSYRGESFVDDMEYVRFILFDCWNRNQYYAGEKLAQDRKFHHLLTDIINRMEDPILERRLKNPLDVIHRIHDITEQSKITEPIQNTKLRTPFEYTSAEEMPEDSDLLSALYADNVPWLKEVTSFGTVIISGPRGSGKSMILKNMRLITKLASFEFDKQEFDKLGFLGFYVHSQQNLYIPFAGTSFKEKDIKTQEKFVHYLNLLFTSEILEALISLESRNFILLSPNTKISLYEFMEGKVLQKKLTKEFLSVENILIELKSIIEKEILLAQSKIVFNKKLQKMTRVGYLTELVTFLSNNVFRNSRPFYFLLDDYSNPKVPFDIQKSLNRIIGFRNSKYCFKITTEKLGFIPQDLDGKFLQQDREFTYLDLGGRYIKYDGSQRKEFIKEIIARRLKRAEINLDPDQFFGNRRHNNIAEALLFEKQGHKKKNTRVIYSGFETIYRLCMGDVGTILTLCRDIYAVWISKKQTIDEPVDYKIQDKAIRDFSKRRLDSIKELPIYGEQLYRLVEVFGDISKKYLYEYSKSSTNYDYREVLRIDLVENPNCLKGEAKELLTKLITEHIFLDAGTAYPLGKGISNIQLILRPIYTPVLKISYTNRYAVRMSCSQLKGFLSNPEKFIQSGNRFLNLVSNDGTSIDGKTLTLDSYYDGVEK